ncbi:AraC family transcriptional regulator [Enterococcus songbeiensis]
MDVSNLVTIAHEKSNHHSSPFHRHTGYELYFFLHGNADFYTEKKGFKLKPGYLVLIKPGIWHKVKTNDVSAYERIYINFSKEFIQNISTKETDLSLCFYKNSQFELPIVKLTNYGCQNFVSLAHQLQQAALSNSFGKDIKIKALLMEILLLANQMPQISEDKVLVNLPQLLSEIILFIDIHLADDLSIPRFSENFFMSGAYLSRYFKKFMGITLQDYIISKRIEYAKQLLLSGKTVDESCEESGFRNYYNFIRTFKTRVGMPPGAFKKLND